MVTPEMLLFLAGKMGLPNPVAEQGECCYVEAPGVWRKFNPATDDAQFGRLVVWAPTQRLSITIWKDAVLVMPKDGDEQWQEHTNTPDSIRAAAVVAIVRALGWEGQE